MNVTTRFMSHEEFMKVREKAGTKTAFDWNCLDGDTILEKYEPLYVKLVEVTNVIIRKGGYGYFWVLCNPLMGTVFENAMGFKESPTDYFPQGTEEILWIGTLHRKWRLYTDPLYPTNEILIGCTESPAGEPKYYATMLVANFVQGDDDDSDITADLLRMLSQSGLAPNQSKPND